MSAKILVIDDEEGIRDAFSMALDELGYHVVTAENGEEGVKAAEEFAPELVFLDLKMPGINGVETLRRIKDMHPDVRVWIVTGFAQEFMQELQEANRDGLDFELARKPIERQQIQQIAQSMFETMLV